MRVWRRQLRLGAFLRWLWAVGPPAPTFPVPVGQIVLFLMVLWGVLMTVGGVHGRWLEARYDAEGLQTDTGTVVATWATVSLGGEGDSTTYHLRYRFLDRAGRPHEGDWSERFGGNGTKTKPSWDRVAIGARLPAFEYLASDPSYHRPAARKGERRNWLWVGLGLLAAIVPFRLAYGAVTSCGVASGRGTR